jgi:hypothetical protein
MSKKHYEIIARVLRESRVTAETHPNDAAAHNHALDVVAHALAKELKTTNSAFDKSRFIAACRP